MEFQQSAARMQPPERSAHLAASGAPECAEPRGRAADRFAAFFDRYYPMALAYAYRRVRDRELAEEIVERAFFHTLRAFQKPNSQATPSSAWVYQVVTNEIRRHFRSLKAYRLAIRRWFDQRRQRIPEGAATASPEMPESEQIRVALERIGEKYSTVIVLRYFEQLPTREIASILCANESTVRTQIERGLRKLRDHLETARRD